MEMCIQCQAMKHIAWLRQSSACEIPKKGVRKIDQRQTIMKHNHLNENIVIFRKFPSLAALEAVISTISSWSSDNKLHQNEDISVSVIAKFVTKSPRVEHI